MTGTPGGSEIDTSVPHEARMYDYWLGGKDNYPPDRALGERIREQIPTISAMARANRAFLVRAVSHLGAEAGIRQFLDIGTGIPTAPNVHQIAQAVDPASNVLYVDIDPLVLAHARALMVGTPQGRTAFVLGDFLDPDAILAGPELAETLDLGRPVALLLVMMLMYFDPAAGADPYPVVRRLVDALPSGSHLVVSQPTADFDPAAMAGARAATEAAGRTLVPRSRDEVAAFFTGMEMVDPGVVPMLSWRPDARLGTVDPHSVYCYAAMGRKP